VEDDTLSRDELRRMRDLLAERLDEEGEGGNGADAGGEGAGEMGGGWGDGEGAS
jgi:hypothetical protein